MKTVSKEEYQRRVEQASPPSPVGKDCLLAFLFGGAICTLGQALCNLYQSLGLELPQARTGVSISLIFLSALLTALGLYDKIAQHAGYYRCKYQYYHEEILELFEEYDYRRFLFPLCKLVGPVLLLSRSDLLVGKRFAAAVHLSSDFIAGHLKILSAHVVSFTSLFSTLQYVC